VRQIREGKGKTQREGKKNVKIDRQGKVPGKKIKRKAGEETRMGKKFREWKINVVSQLRKTELQ